MRLIELVKAYPNKEWDWYALSENPNININDMINNPKLPFVWELATTNPSISLNDILTNSNKSWNWNKVSYRDDLTIDIVNSYNVPWNTKYFPKGVYTTKYVLENCDTNDLSVINFLSRNKTLTIQNILSNLHLKWNWSALSNNPSITFDNILSTLHLPWDWNKISKSSKITINDIIKYYNLPWDWAELTKICHINDIYNNLDLPWVLEELSYNKTITTNDILTKSNINWNIYMALYNPNVSIYELEKHIEFTTRNINSNICLTEDFINKYKNILTCSSVSAYSNVSLRYILDHPEYEWHWVCLSENPHIKIIDIYNNPELPWDWEKLSRNIFKCSYC
jgi:hypothetical protein